MEALEEPWMATGVEDDTRASSIRTWSVGASGAGRRRMETAECQERLTVARKAD